ncbi:hypothetical protein Tel_00005 [Candidatus Tenderia electrophaga]|jgi:hypothetical protein|uniref:SPOR domain-containing protein n=1 Tax=Candidatus Tenderia electrophaga TaxID=1748243 RepID=A0A0S2THL8_9GAMM|nr:hypothetical protein Tel_00005 [Candidatus Tenderia electrophaga]
MKWVAISLLLLNGIYLVIQLDKQQDSAPEVERFPFSGPPLVLVSEQQAQDKNAKPTTDQKPPQQVAQAEAPTPQAPATRAKPEPAAPPATPPPKPTAPAPQPAPAPKPKSNAMACYRVGPFLLISDVRGVSQLFSYGDIKVQERSETLRKQVGYWVYIPPQDSLEQARETLRRMKDNGIADALIISEGSKANAVSVGVYKSEALGQERLDSLRELGYTARQEPLFRTQAQYWLELELMKSTQIPETLWREVTAGYPNIQQLRHKCN